MMDIMDPEQPSLEEKLAFFAQLEYHSGNDGEDQLGKCELKNRERCRSFFHKRPTTTTPKPRDAANAVRELPSVHVSDSRFLHRRISSAPSPPTQIIKGTPVGAIPRKGPLRSLRNAESSVVKETPIADAVGTRRTGLQRSESTPMNPSKRLLTGGSEASPSAAIGVKKRKRDSTVKLRPETEQIFRGLSFFYIPNNDIAPARRLRINKAKEFGAEWTQAEWAATHFIVDKNLEYKDIQEFISRAGRRGALKVVNEEYPIDCIRFKAVLDHTQKRYLVQGQSSIAPDDTNTVPASSSEESTKSLQVKPLNRERGWRDYIPSRSDHSTQRSPLAEAQSEPDLVVLDLGSLSESNPGTNLGQEDDNTGGSKDYRTELGEQESCSIAKPAQNESDDVPDELSQYIAEMQKYKDLPLDVDEDDFGNSISGSVRAGSATDDDHDLEGERMRRSSRKTLRFEDRFACNRATSKDAHSANPNARTIEVLQSMADYYDRMSDQWRTIGYRKAITTLKNQTIKINTEEQALRLPNIGQRLAQKIEEIVTTNKLQRLEYAENEPMDESLQLFLGIYGVGVSQAQQWVAQGFRTLDDLKAGAKLSRNQTIGVEHYEDLNMRIPRREVEALGAVVKKAAAEIDGEVEMIIGGSYRRGSDSSNDIDFIVTKQGTDSTASLREFLDKLVGRLEASEFLVARLASSQSTEDGSKWHGCCVLPRIKGFNDDDSYKATWRRIDFLLVPETEKGAALIYFTGNDIFNRSMRLLAQKKNMRLNQRGLYRDAGGWPRSHKVTEEDLIEGRDERRIFEILGVKWREPHERWC